MQTAKIEANMTKAKPQHRNPARGPGGLPGGTIINIVVAIIFFGLLGLGIWWVIKGLGEATGHYTGAMIDAQQSAITIQCQMNLRTTWQNLQVYTLKQVDFPPSSQVLLELCESSQLLACPAPDGAKYVYIPGQTSDMSPQNILIFEAKATHDGSCNVLRLNGRIELLTPEQLRQAIAQTRAILLSNPR